MGDKLLAGLSAVRDRVDAAVANLPTPVRFPDLADILDHANSALREVDSQLRGGPGLRCMLDQTGLDAALTAETADIEKLVTVVEGLLDQATAASTADVERVNASLVGVKDACWAIRQDRVKAAAAVAALAGPDPTPAAIEAYAAINIALASLDRLELRGRDSAGVHVLVSGHSLDLHALTFARKLQGRCKDVLFTSTAVRTPLGHLSFVYKAANEIGRLGDNGLVLRSAIAADELLRAAVQAPAATVAVLGHTRWASVGMINEANAHPLNSEEIDHDLEIEDRNYVVAALNGDVDNHAQLAARHHLRIPQEITTDAKVIPVLIARRLASGMGLSKAFWQTVDEFDGSVAIAASTAQDPTTLLLAQRGSGQALYVGIAEGTYVVASEPYGLVEECRRYLRMDGGGNEGLNGHCGQVVTLDGRRAGSVAGIHTLSYDGTSEMAVQEDDLRVAEITTRDIDLRGYLHFLHKEIHEAPASVRKTLRGRIRDVDGSLQIHVGTDVLPSEIAHRLAVGKIRRVLVIGQGTAAVAGDSVAAAIAKALAPRGLSVSSMPATELSGLGLTPEMGDVLAIAISQSGTTADTNCTVDLLRSRGAAVLAIVNRRGSDLVDKSDGVLFTADGRDVEMSVASTKAFFAQVAAGQLLALALARAAGCADPIRESELLAALHSLPTALQDVLDCEQRIAELAHRHAPLRRSWAVVGNGRNRIAAEEIRIKWSELCYKSVACDATENKKHIDLSSEPLTLVCAAGLLGSVVDDVVKEVAIFRAHNGIPIVIATAGETRFDAVSNVIFVPMVHSDFAFVLSAMVGHLFGYYAALAIDEQALPLRQARAAIEQAGDISHRDPDEMLTRLSAMLPDISEDFFGRLRAGRYNSALDASTAARIALAMQTAVLSSTQIGISNELARFGEPGAVLDEMATALTVGIDELTRPIDAIKHQAKTVTVGISRADEAVLTVPLVRSLLNSGVSRTCLSYAVLRTVAGLDPAVAEVTGYTRYRIDGPPDDPATKIIVVAKHGIAESLPSRTEQDHRLRGTKQLVAAERQPLVAIGRGDGRTVIIVPEVTAQQTSGLTLLHVRCYEQLPIPQICRILEGYRGRLARLRSAVTETEPIFDETLLADLAPVRLLTDPIDVLADHWCGRDPGIHPG